MVPDDESEISARTLGEVSSSGPESEETDRKWKKSKKTPKKRRQRTSTNYNFAADSRSLSVPRRKRFNSSTVHLDQEDFNDADDKNLTELMNMIGGTP